MCLVKILKYVLIQVPYVILDPRIGDAAACYADCKLAQEELGWKANRGLQKMCRFQI